MQWLFAGLALLLVIYGFLRWVTRANPQTIRYGLTLVGIVVLLLFAFLLILTGRAVVSWPFIIAALGLYSRLRQAIGLWTLLGRLFGGKPKMRPNKTSHVETSHIHMRLDHGSATLDGKILQGKFAGQWLSDLSTTEIFEKLSELSRADSEGARLLESYLDRNTAGWRSDFGQGNGDRAREAPTGKMTRLEALQILGLEGNPEREEIKAAHKDLMRKFHPDRGGSSYLASKINQAKDMLLDKNV